jgi:hypothetical protein
VSHGLDLAFVVIGFLLPDAGVVFMEIAGAGYILWFPLFGFSLKKLTEI